MDNYSQVTAGPTAGRLRRAWGIILITVVPLFALALYIENVGASQSGKFIIFGAIPAILITLWFKKIELSGILTITVLVLTGLLAITWVNGLGILVGASVAIISYAIVSQMFEENHKAAAFSVIGVITTAIIFVDLLAPFNRIILGGQVNTLNYVISAVSAVLLTYFLLRNFRKYNLRTKFMTSVAILAITAVVFNILYTTYSSRRIVFETTGRTLKSQTFDNANLLVTNIESSINRLQTAGRDSGLNSRLYFRNVEYAGKSAAEISQIIDSNAAVWETGQAEEALTPLGTAGTFVTNLLISTMNSAPEWSHIQLVDQQGGTFALTEYVPLYDNSQTIWWQTAITGKTYIGQPDSAPGFQADTLTIAVPVFDENEEIVGVLKGSYRFDNLAFLETMISSPNPSSNGLTDIIIGSKVLSFRNRELTITDLALTQQELDEIEQRTYSRVEWKGKMSLIAVASLPGTTFDAISQNNFRVLKYITEEEVIGTFTNQQRGQVFIGIATLLAAITAAYIVSNIVTQPILDLTETAQRFAAGDLRVRSDVSTGDEISTLAGAFNFMAQEVENSVHNLESNVAERTQALNTSFRISRSLVSVINREELVNKIVGEIKEAFDYYHVHMYLVNQKTDRLELVAGSGEIGKKLLDRKHSLAAGKGLVGRAAATNLPILAADTQADPNWLPNDLLPETKSELAVPISIGNEVMGVIDVQDNVPNGLKQEDRELLQSIADQTAVALRNAEFVRLAEERAQREGMINNIRQKILQTRSIENALKTAAREIGQISGRDVGIHLAQSESSILQDGHKSESHNGAADNGS